MHDIYYLTDLHGQYSLFQAMIDYCLKQDADCSILYGGDACDRGPDGYRLMHALLEHPNVGYLKGNHEAMFVQAAQYLLKYYAEDATFHNKKTKDEALKLLERPAIQFNTNLYFSNGGLNTIIDWLMDGASANFVDTIAHLPLTFSYGKLDFCHAGANYSHFENAQKAEYYDAPVDATDENELLWNRTMLSLGWVTDRICIFGHTPTILLPKGIYGHDLNEDHIHPCAWQDKMGAKDKRGGWKIDMDTGATWTGRAYLLNCNTLEVIGFYDSSIITKNPADVIKIIETYKII